MTERAERNDLPQNIKPCVDGIFKRLDKDVVLQLLAFTAKKEHIIEYLQVGTINKDHKLSPYQMVSKLYFGTEYSYGPTDNKAEIMQKYPMDKSVESKAGYESRIAPMIQKVEQSKMILPANPQLVEDLALLVPDSEKNMPKTKPKAVSSGIKSVIMRMKEAGFTLEQAMAYGKTEEEKAYAVELYNKPEDTDLNAML